MDILLLILFIVFCISCKYKRGGNDEYMSIESTRTINGVFVVFIFFRHSFSYIEYQKLDFVYSHINQMLGQLIVASFFLYSGYGIMNSFITKKEYKHRLLVRIMNLWFKYLIAIFFYTLLNCFLDREFSLIHYMKSIFAWESIGNSNWFIFSTLSLYFFTYFAFSVAKNNNTIIIILLMLCLCYTTLLIRLGKPSWWYDTIWAFVLGIIFRTFEDMINDKLTCIRGIKWGLDLVSILILMGIINVINSSNILGLSIYSLLFCILLIVFTSKVHVKNSFFHFLGYYCFEIYIYQRLVMIVFQKLDILSINIIIIICSGIATIYVALKIRKIEDFFVSKMENCKWLRK